MTPDEFVANFETVAEAPGGTKRLRELVLVLAMRGKLVDQDAVGELMRVQTSFESNAVEAAYDLPESWQWISLAQVFVSVSTSGKKIFTSEVGEHGSYPVVDQGQVLVRGYTERQDALIRVSTPVIVFGDHTRQIKFVNFDFVAGADGTKILLPKPFVDARYFFWALKSFRLEDRGYGRHYSILLKKPFPLPPLAEQKRIVAKVDQLMALCDDLEAQQARKRETAGRLNRAALDALTIAEGPEEVAASFRRVAENFEVLIVAPESVSRLRQAILRLAVRGHLVRQDRTELPFLLNGSAPAGVSLSSVTYGGLDGALPQGWKVAPLSSVADLKSGTTIDPSLECQVGDVPYLKVGDMNLPGNERDAVTSSRFVMRSVALEKQMIRPRSVIFPKRGGAIATNKKRRVWSPILVDLNVMAIMCSPEILFEYVCRWFDQIDLAELDNGTSVPQINHKDIAPLLIPLPPLAEQKRIVAKVDQLMALCDTLEAALRRAETTAQKLAEAVVAEIVA